MDKLHKQSHAWVMKTPLIPPGFGSRWLVLAPVWTTAGLCWAADGATGAPVHGSTSALWGVLVSGALLGMAVLQGAGPAPTVRGLAGRLGLFLAALAAELLVLSGATASWLGASWFPVMASLVGGSLAWLALGWVAGQESASWLQRFMWPAAALYGAGWVVHVLGGSGMAYLIFQLSALYLMGLIAWTAYRLQAQPTASQMAMSLAPLALTHGLLALAGAHSEALLVLLMLANLWAGWSLSGVLQTLARSAQDARLAESESAMEAVSKRLDQLQARERELEMQMADKEVDLRNSQIMVRDLAQHDPLTGLPSRRLFADRYAVAAARAKREGHGFSLVLIDVDQLNQINQKRGHLVGDGLLQVVARKLGDVMRTSDTLARMGGDEFALLLPNTTENQALETVCKKIQEAMEGELLCAGVRLHATVSMGAALFGRDGTGLDDIYEAASRSLRKAKEEGRNTYRIAAV